MKLYTQRMLGAVQENKKSITYNRRLDLVTGFVENLTIAAIFGSFLTKSAEAFLEKTGHYIFFPAAGLLNFVRTGFALNLARLEKGKNGTREKAMLEVSSSAMVGTAVIGGLAEAPYAKFAPHIFTGMLAIKTGFYAGAALYYIGKAAGSAEEAVKQNYKHIAKVNSIAAASLLLSTGATGAVMILGEVVGFAEIGIAANLFAAGYQLYSAYTMKTPTSSVTIEEEDEEADLESGHAAVQSQSATSDYQPPVTPNSPAGIHRALNIVPTLSPHSPNVQNDHVTTVATSSAPVTKPSNTASNQPAVTDTERRTYQRL